MEIIHARLKNIAKSSNFYLEEIGGEITRFDKAEFVIGKKANLDSNDFYLKLKINDFINYDLKENDLLYIPNTEFGGVIKKIEHETDDTVTITGVNWRYFLHRFVVFPKWSDTYKARDDYLNITNIEANKALGILFDNVYYSAFLNLFRISDNDTKINITTQSRYDYLYDKLIAMLDEVGMRLKVHHSYDYDDCNIVVEAVSKNRIDDVYNRDYSIEINSTIDSTESVDTLIALGKGDLHDRKIVLIKHTVDDKGNDVFTAITDLSSNQVGTLDSSMYVYDYKSCDSDEDLVAKAIEEFKENHLATKEITLGVSSSKKELQLGDIITGQDDITGLTVETEITKKTLTIENGVVKIEYKVGD